MSSIVDLTETGMSNGALAEIGEPPIISIDDPERAAARHCKRFFSDVRDQLLKEGNWQFARNSCTPAALPTAPNRRWRYRYPMPPDCVSVIQIGGDYDSEPFECPSTGDDVTVAVMLDANACAPTVWYTRRIVNPAQWDPLFRRLFQFALAAKVNPLIGRDKSLTATLVALARGEKDEATKRDSQGRVGQQISRTTSWVRSRWGYTSWRV